MQKAALLTSGALFAIATIAHGVRLFTEFEISMAGVIVPVWVSYPGVLVAAALTTWMVMAAWRS
ncbi:MAG: hypothetical protein CL569_01005 [Alphaproteobacteria bacterium]|nr:hypothetical protein [Alphaproteobacteria bacterium]